MSEPERARGCVAGWLLGLGLLSLLSSCGTAGRGPAGAQSSATVAPLIATAESALERGDHDVAIAAYLEARELTPWNTRIEWALAGAYAARAASVRDQDRAEGLPVAERDLREALRLLPDDPALRRSLALVLVEQANHERDASRVGALREEARRFDSQVVEDLPARAIYVERRLDLALELIQRGQLEAAVQDLERLHREHPEHAGALLLLAQAEGRAGADLVARGDHAGAGARFDRSVELYARLEDCGSGACTAREFETAHENRITTWINAGRPETARHALEDARRAGLRFPRLAGALSRP